MNLIIFAGRVAAAPELKTHGDTKVVKFRLIRNEYAGTDDAGNKKERTVTLPLVAFGKRAQAIADNVRVGRQLIVHASIRNNNYGEGDQARYDYNFEVEDFEFGAPGQADREAMAAGAGGEGNFRD